MLIFTKNINPEEAYENSVVDDDAALDEGWGWSRIFWYTHIWRCKKKEAEEAHQYVKTTFSCYLYVETLLLYHPLKDIFNFTSRS